MPEAMRERMQSTLGRAGADTWLTLSEHVQRDAVLGRHRDALDDLEQVAAQSDTPMAAGYRLWTADALARAARPLEAVHAYDAVVTAAAGPFPTIDFRAEALRHRAGAFERLGDVDAAVASYRDALAADGPRSLLRAGKAAERAGRVETADGLYGEIAAAVRGSDAEDPAQQALRARERLTVDGEFSPSVLGVVQRVEAALTRRDGKELRQLASTTHFQAGPGGGHFRFEDDDVLDWLCADLHASRPRRMGRSLLGSGAKRYFFTRGWKGKRFRGMVGFCFVRSSRGWEWAGVVVTAPASPWLDRWAPAEKATNQPLPFPLLAPWAEGRHFTAGGLGGFIAQSAAVIAAGPFGPAVAFGFSLADCGFGLRGFYYNQGPTHSGMDGFAIDFTSYRRRVPFDNIAGGTPVLAAAPGVVRMVIDTTSSGDDSNANEVQIDHADPATGMPRFVSRSMHLAGPTMVPVSAGMALGTGRRLGVMNDTGTSVLDHLHFSMHDSAAGPGIGPSVRPFPMEGRTLGDGDSGACIRSSNREPIVIELPPGCGRMIVDAILALARGRGRP